MREEVSDGQGGAVTGFAVVTSLWARIVPVSARDEERADEEVFTVTHRIWIRFREDLVAGMRFRKGGRLFRSAGLVRPGRDEALSRLPMRGGGTMSAATALQKAIYGRLAGDADADRADRGWRRAGSSADGVASARRLDCQPGEPRCLDRERSGRRASCRRWRFAPAKAATGRRSRFRHAFGSLLDDAELVLDGFAFVSLFHRRTRIGRDAKAKGHVAEMVFRAVTE